MSKEDAYREAREKLAGTKKREARLRAIRSNRDKSFDQQRETIFSAISSQGIGNVERCLQWAFGYDYGIIPMSIWPVRWNTTKGKLFKIDKADDIVSVFKKIGQAYKHFVIEPLYKQIKENKNGKKRR